MNPDLAVDIVRQIIQQALLLVTPVLVTSMSVGVGVSLLQSVTSIQEQTLTFVPKLVAVAGVFLVGAAWMVRSMVEFGTRMITMIADMPQ